MAGASIKIGASSSEFQKQMKEVTNQLKLVSSECGVATEKAKLFGSTQDKLSAIQKELTSKIQAQNKIVQIYKDRIKGINGEVEKQKAKQSELATQIENATRSYKDCVQATGKSSEESKKLKDELQDLKEAYARNEKAIESNNNKLVTATSKMNNTEKSILQNKSALENVNREINNFKLDKISEGFENVSEKTGKVAENLGKASAAIGAAGVAVGKMALDTESALDLLQGKLGLTSEEADKLKEVAKGVYNNGFGESIEDTVNSLAILETNLKSTKSWSDETKQATLEQIMAMNGLFGTETSELTKTLSVMQNSGLTEDITSSLDILTAGFQNGANYSDELLDTMREYAPQFVKLGLSADEAMNYLITGADNGAFNLDKVGDAMKEFSIRAIDGSKTTVEGFELLNLNADEMAKKFAEGGEGAKGAFSEVVQAISSVEDPLMQSQIGVDLFGTMWEDLGPQVITSLGTVKGGIEGVDGATAKLVEQQKNTFGTEFKSTLREAKASLEPLGTEVLKIAQVALPPLKEILSKVTEFMSRLNDKQRQMIISGAGVVLAAAATFKGISSLSDGIGKAVTKFGDLKEKGSKAVGIIKDFGSKALNGAKAAGQFALNLGKSALAFGKNAAQAGLAAAKMVAHKVATIASSIATNTMAAAQAALNFVMSLNPITLIIIGITALIATIILLWNKCEWFRNLCLGLFEAIKVGWNATIEFLKKVWRGLVSGLKSAWNGFKTAFQTVGNVIKSLWKSITSSISTTWKNIVSGIKGAWNGWKIIFNSVGETIKSVWRGITSSISNVWNGVVNGVKSAWQGITKPFRSVVDSIGGMWQGIKSMFKLPHFTISGTLNPLKWNDQGMPKIGVDWYYKGGIFKTPTVLGNIGVGDAFNGQGSNAEAVVPLDSMYSNIDRIISSRLEKLATLDNKKQPLVLQTVWNGRVVAESIASESDIVAGRRMSLAERGVAL